MMRNGFESPCNAINYYDIAAETLDYFKWFFEN